MDTTIKTPIVLPKALFDQAESLAQGLNISQSQLFERAIEGFVRSHQAAKTEVQTGKERRVINQGDIYWVQLENPGELEVDIPHPYVIIQENLFNYSRIHTVVACALTSNIRRVSDTPGNILLDIGEANLPKQSVVEVSKVSSIDKKALDEYIGSLSDQRVNQIVAGMRFLQRSSFAR